ncbi:MAG: hypothetical protein DHS20C21_16200 [Gemmatimonadota bacterium]|nr:MAG: hypothetical protein DHS20C21_16200 [Gemmatimonadota bacterium]
MRSRQKDFRVLIFLVMLGMVVGSAVGEAIGLVLPAGVVKDFFLKSVTWGFGPTPLNLVAFTLTIGFAFDVNMMAVLGIVFAAYLFRWY